MNDLSARTPFPGAIAVHAPAKVNLLLAVTGLRPDGFHNLVSLVAPLSFGDTLWLAPTNLDHFSCSDPNLDTGPTNLVSKALSIYRSATGYDQPVRVHLQKRIPIGSGFGGGSSDAVALLKGINGLNPQPLDPSGLTRVSSEIGSDCPLFFGTGPVWMEGRGEFIDPVKPSLSLAIRGQGILIFHPGFEVSTVWAYKALRDNVPDPYSSPSGASAIKSDIETSPSRWRDFIHNDLYPPVAQKYLAIPALIRSLKHTHGIAAYMSGSGSGCFAIPTSDHDISAIRSSVIEAWGPESFFEQTAFV